MIPGVIQAPLPSMTIAFLGADSFPVFLIDLMIPSEVITSTASRISPTSSPSSGFPVHRVTFLIRIGGEPSIARSDRLRRWKLEGGPAGMLIALHRSMEALSVAF